MSQDLRGGPQSIGKRTSTDCKIDPTCTAALFSMQKDTHTHQDLDTAPGFSMTPSEHLPARYRRGAPKNVLHSSSGELFSETGLTWGAKSGGSGKGGCTTVINVEGEG